MSSSTSKFVKRKKEKHAGKLLAMQQMLMMHADKVITSCFMIKLPELKKIKEDLTYDEISHVILKMIEGINKPENVEIFNALAGVVYTESEEDEIKCHEESLDEFIRLAKEYVTTDLIMEILGLYDPKKEKLESILDGVRMANEISTGERYEVTDENPEEPKGDFDGDVYPTTEVK
ncbi:MAG: hypothetical protein ACRCX2_00785 [Paraclostridium sp.]